MNKKAICYLCKSHCADNTCGAGFREHECPVCGKYIITGSAIEKIEELDKQQPILYKWASIAAERNLQNGPFFLDIDENYYTWHNSIQHTFEKYTPIGVNDFIKNYPSSVIERLDRALHNLGRMTSRCGEIGKTISFGAIASNCYYSLFAKSYEEGNAILSLLEEQNLVRCKKESEIMSSVSVTAKGWQKIAELEKQWEHSNKVFLAMWFDKNTTSNLREAVREAVKAAGYDSPEIAVDETPHNDFITNKIINMITDAKFVIADFTCSPEVGIAGEVRGGVYFEAGLARGMGKEVIHTCSHTTKDNGRLHFDVNQINTIFWKEEKDAEGNVVLKSYDSDFIDVLKHRIIATVGKGKQYKEQ